MLNFFKKKKQEEVPVVAKKHGIRVSKPYGLFPQDVESVLVMYENEKAKLQEIIEKTRKENETLKKDNEDLKATITQLRFDMSLIEVPDSTDADDFHNINKLKELKNKKVEVEDESGLEIISI